MLLTTTSVIDTISAMSQKSNVYRFILIGSIKRGYVIVVSIQFDLVRIPMVTSLLIASIQHSFLARVLAITICTQIYFMSKFVP